VWSSIAGSGAADGRQRRVSSLASTAHKSHELRRRRRIYLQNLSFELDCHRLRHRLDFVDELDACVSSDGHHLFAVAVAVAVAVGQSPCLSPQSLAPAG